MAVCNNGKFGCGRNRRDAANAVIIICTVGCRVINK